ncbi:type IV pilus twitching motility protein PilT [Puniceicoccus vermicola]|uniref:PilT/PilU family type 4a pilus ATPase n=1 Tax=Puniceicoccus vermicola TaxID=388746 RepID=A0A7X1AX10_9BACT|nr:PilT/PilU family type 4a pilus ATPase [Puniceicoccus vermicola]MBC2601329.1 PilT/PilU family type 4a pilus ATPase [Puniceicoccus vermicola]
MRKDLHWFFHQCSEENILSPEQIHGALRSIYAKIDLEDLGTMLTDSGWIEDQSFIKKAIKEARKHSARGDEAPPLPVLDSAEFHGVLPDFAEWAKMDDEDLKTAMRGWIESCVSEGVSDLHVTSNARPRIRFHRQIQYLSEETLDPEIAERMNLILLADEKRKLFDENWEVDYALPLKEMEGGSQLRLRVNLMRHEYGISAVYHMPRAESASLEELGFPNAEKIRELLSYHNGMILIAGPVGCGKTTTLSCLVNELNETRQEHIITIEDPIEIIQQSKKSIVTQRQVGKHTRSFDEALASSLREDPDIIVVGEMRDLETIEMAVTAAETGHLVIGTLHTRDSATTLNRLIDVFPPIQQRQIRTMVADSLRGVICQRLIPSTDGGLVLASELMVNTSATANIMREGKEAGLDSAMQTGRKHGMRTMDESIVELFETGQISWETALSNIKDPNLLGQS